MMCANNPVHRVNGPMVVFVSLRINITLRRYHHYADVSDSIELLKCLSGTFCRVCVWVEVNHLNQFSRDDYENTSTLSYHRRHHHHHHHHNHHQIGRMNNFPSFRVRPWNNGMHCMSFYVLIIHFPYHSPFVERIHQSSVDTTKKRAVSGFSFVVKQQKHMNKQSCRWWYETWWCSHGRKTCS